MPYKFETVKFKVGREKNRRIKLSNNDRDLIRSLKNDFSQRQLAEMFKVSRSLIRFVIDPNEYEKSKRRRRMMGQAYYNKEKHKVYMKNTRDYKKVLFKNRKINK